MTKIKFHNSFFSKQKMNLIKISSFDIQLFKLDSEQNEFSLDFYDEIDDYIEYEKQKKELEDYQLNFRINNTHKFEIIISITSLNDFINLISKSEFTIEQTNKSSSFVFSRINFSPKIIEFEISTTVCLMKTRFAYNKNVEYKLCRFIKKLKNDVKQDCLSVIHEEEDNE